MSLNPITRKEEYYDGMINDTPVPDPVTREEHFLGDLADKIAQGGGGATSVTLAASGNNLSGDISLADLKTALSNGVVLLSFPTDGNADERVVAEYTDDSTNGLRIGVFSEDEYIVYSVVDDGNDGVTLTVVSEKGLGHKTYTLDSSGASWILIILQQFVMSAIQAQAFTVTKTNFTWDQVEEAIEYIDRDGYIMLAIPSMGAKAISNNYVSNTDIKGVTVPISTYFTDAQLGTYYMDATMYLGDTAIIMAGQMKAIT